MQFQKNAGLRYDIPSMYMGQRIAVVLIQSRQRAVVIRTASNERRNWQLPTGPVEMNGDANAVAREVATVQAMADVDVSRLAHIRSRLILVGKTQSRRYASLFRILVDDRELDALPTKSAVGHEVLAVPCNNLGDWLVDNDYRLIYG